MEIHRQIVRILVLISLVFLCYEANAQVAYYVDVVAGKARISFDNGATWQYVANTSKKIKYRELDGQVRISNNYGQAWQWVYNPAPDNHTDAGSSPVKQVEFYWKEGRMEIDFSNNVADYIVTDLTGEVFARGRLSGHVVLELPRWSVYLVTVVQGSSLKTCKFLAY